MAWATLGDIVFSTRLGWTGYKHAAGAEYAEHALARGKPRLQFMGEKLDDISVEFALQIWFSDPQARIQQLRDAKAAGKALSLVFGNGDYRGRFVLSELEVTLSQTDGQGNIIALSGEMKLREFIGDPAQTDAPARAPAQLPAGAVSTPPPFSPGPAPPGLSVHDLAMWAIQAAARRAW